MTAPARRPGSSRRGRRTAGSSAPRRRARPRAATGGAPGRGRGPASGRRGRRQQREQLPDRPEAADDHVVVGHRTGAAPSAGRVLRVRMSWMLTQSTPRRRPAAHREARPARDSCPRHGHPVTDDRDLAESDLMDPALRTDGAPHALLVRMRRQAPVRWNPNPDGSGFWSLTRHEHVTQVSKGPGDVLLPSGRGSSCTRPQVGPLDLTRSAARRGGRGTARDRRRARSAWPPRGPTWSPPCRPASPPAGARRPPPDRPGRRRAGAARPGSDLETLILRGRSSRMTRCMTSSEMLPSSRRRTTRRAGWRGRRGPSAARPSSARRGPRPRRRASRRAGRAVGGGTRTALASGRRCPPGSTARGGAPRSGPGRPPPPPCGRSAPREQARRPPRHPAPG